MHKGRTLNGQKARALAVPIGALVALLLAAPLVSALMGGEGFMWTVSPDAPIKLDVCWENPQEADETARAWARLALKRSWERYARVIFVGWDTCQNEASPADPPHTYGPRRPGTLDENIKIHINTTGGGQNPAHGSWGDYQQSGLILNLYCGKGCVEHLAIHEMGHALGFYHGEERGDWPSPPGCPQQTYPPSPPWWPVPTERRWGKPDVDSTMAYCSGQSSELSPIDIAGVRRAYERRLPGTVLSPVASLCLAAHAALPNGDRAFGWECDEAFDDQEWYFSPIVNTLHIEVPDGGPPRCLDVDTNNYTDVQMWDCHYGPNQRWRFRNVLLRGYGGLCLTQPLSRLGAVTMETCTGADSQLWRLEPGDYLGAMRIRAEKENVCLAATGVKFSSVTAEPCYGNFEVYVPLVATRMAEVPVREVAAAVAPVHPEGGGQDFQLIEGGQIRLPSVGGSTQWCLDVQDEWDSDFRSGKGGPEPGQRVQVFNCLSSQLNQRWNLTGDIMSGGKCLALSGNAKFNGAPAVVSTCNDSDVQDWDYYW